MQRPRFIIIISFLHTNSPTVTFELVLSNFTECSVSCGCGFQTRTAECVRVETLNNVVLNETAANLTDCLTQSGVMAPVLRQDCNDFPCPFWLTGEISPVSCV